MIRRSILSCAVVVAALLALAAPALAGGWAVITLDSLPKEVRAGQPLHLGFVIRQHGRTPVNTDWDGHALKPVLTARKTTTTSGSQGGNLVMECGDVPRAPRVALLHGLDQVGEASRPTSPKIRSARGYAAHREREAGEHGHDGHHGSPNRGRPPPSRRHHNLHRQHEGEWRSLR